MIKTPEHAALKQWLFFLTYLLSFKNHSLPMNFAVFIESFSFMFLLVLCKYNGCSKSLTQTVANEFNPEEMVL